ncbi:MAG: HINT domain-containing protein [Planctomycetes bacterium]|nr:HINT domain-containing protein [Planctomycetota bacterium]
MVASSVRASWNLSVRFFVAGSGAFALLLLANFASAQSAKALHQRHAAEDLVAEALQRQIYGKFDESGRLLEEALSLAPDCRAARWQTGQVYYTRKWLSTDAAVAAATGDNRLARYEARRVRAANTVEAQLQLAAFCHTEGLLDQERAHLTRVLELNPDEPKARAGLGFTRSGNNWITADERKRTEAQEKTRSESLAAWKSTMEKYVKSLDATSVKRRTYAEGQIVEIRDLKAIPALETILATHNAAAADLAIKALSNMSDPEAALAISRIGVETRWQSARVAAATALKARPRDQFVPALLTSLATATRTKSELYQDPRGRLLLRQVTERERQNDKQQQVVVTEYRRQAAPGDNGRDALNRSLADAQQRSDARTAEADRQREQDQRLNSRIMEVLSVSTGANVVADPAEWWSWWNKENEIYVPDTKPVQTALRSEQVIVRDAARVGMAAQSGGSLRIQQVSSDCLAAGTPVWTETGAKAIETIRIGDRVLSQNVETGELCYKPVLRTTIRPLGPLVQIDLHGEYVQTSGGHPFWIAGDGWVKARNLKAGNVLCAVGEPVLVSSSKVEGSAETYNLVVADFNTYFIGKSRVLCHDNTLRGPTKAVVPGLAAE